jgi:hypothetical protein
MARLCRAAVRRHEIRHDVIMSIRTDTVRVDDAAHGVAQTATADSSDPQGTRSVSQLPPGPAPAFEDRPLRPRSHVQPHGSLAGGAIARASVLDPVVPLPAQPLLTVDHAARLLSTNPTALRARCRRHARRVGREVIARLGAGVVAFKFGASWRLRIESR